MIYTHKHAVRLYVFHKPLRDLSVLCYKHQECVRLIFKGHSISKISRQALLSCKDL